MSYVYIRSEPGLWTVGHRDGGSWEPESDHGSEAEAARRVAWLNGSPSDYHLLIEQRDEARGEVRRLRAGAEKVLDSYISTAKEANDVGDHDTVETCEVVVMKIRRDILGGESA